MDIAELQTAVDAWIKTHGVRYFNELTNMTILVEEVGCSLGIGMLGKSNGGRSERGRKQ